VIQVNRAEPEKVDDEAPRSEIRIGLALPELTNHLSTSYVKYAHEQTASTTMNPVSPERGICHAKTEKKLIGRSTRC
jgi:hypothetical protein